MNPKKFKRLLQAARGPLPMPPPPGFVDEVLRCVRHIPMETPAEESIGGLLTQWAPRIAVASLAAMALGAFVELAPLPNGSPSISEGMAALSNEWLFALDGV